MGVELREGVRFLRLEEDHDPLKELRPTTENESPGMLLSWRSALGHRIYLPFTEKLFSRHGSAGISPQAFRA